MLLFRAEIRFLRPLPRIRFIICYFRAYSAVRAMSIARSQKQKAVYPPNYAIQYKTVRKYQGRYEYIYIDFTQKQFRGWKYQVK